MPFAKASFPPWIDVSPAIARRSVVFPAPFAPASESRSFRADRERHVLEERVACELLAQLGCDEDGHGRPRVEGAGGGLGRVHGLRHERARGRGDVLGVDARGREALLRLAGSRHLANRESHDARRLVGVRERGDDGVSEPALGPVVLDGDEPTARRLGRGGERLARRAA